MSYQPRSGDPGVSTSSASSSSQPRSQAHLDPNAVLRTRGFHKQMPLHPLHSTSSNTQDVDPDGEEFEEDCSPGEGAEINIDPVRSGESQRPPTNMPGPSSEANVGNYRMKQPLSTPNEYIRFARDYWPNQKRKYENMTDHDLRAYCRHMELPMARVKKVMKMDDDVKQQMISQDAPLLLSAAAELFVQELTMRSWQVVEEGRRKTLQKSDISAAVGKHDHFDFLIDIVPRNEDKRTSHGNSTVQHGQQSQQHVVNMHGHSSQAQFAVPQMPSTSTQDQKAPQMQLTYVVAEGEDSEGRKVFQLNDGQLLHAQVLGEPMSIKTDANGQIDMEQLAQLQQLAQNGLLQLPTTSHGQ